VAGAVIENGQRRFIGRGRLPRAVVALIGLVVVVVSLAGLGVQAIRGNRTVSVQRAAVTIRNAALDDAFYRCIDVQARSLVAPGEPVVFSVQDLGDIVTLIKAVGSWVTIANPFSTAVARLSLRNHVTGGGACLGTVVIATSSAPHHGTRIRVGSGASVPGIGPPPAPPL
jgi:hypothetical protein